MKRLDTTLAVLLLGATVACRTSAPFHVRKGNELFDRGKYQEAALRFRKALQVDRNSGEAYYRLGLTNLKLGEGAEAYQNLRRAAGLLPNNQEVKRQLAELCLGAYLADKAHRSSPYQEAKTLTEQILAANSKSSAGLRLQGYLALIDRKPDTAIELLADLPIWIQTTPPRQSPWLMRS